MAPSVASKSSGSQLQSGARAIGEKRLQSGARALGGERRGYRVVHEHWERGAMYVSGMVWETTVFLSRTMKFWRLLIIPQFNFCKQWKWNAKSAFAMSTSGEGSSRLWNVHHNGFSRGVWYQHWTTYASFIPPTLWGNWPTSQLARHSVRYNNQTLRLVAFFCLFFCEVCLDAKPGTQHKLYTCMAI